MALSRSLIVLIALSLALSACGRRGPLEAPVATAPDQAGAGTAPESNRSSAGARIPKEPFLLDPLL